MRIRVGLPRKWQLLWAAVVLGGMAALAIAQPSSGRSGQIVPLGPDTPRRVTAPAGRGTDRDGAVGGRGHRRKTGVSSRDASALRCRHSRFLSTIPC